MGELQHHRLFEAAIIMLPFKGREAVRRGVLLLQCP